MDTYFCSKPYKCECGKTISFHGLNSHCKTKYRIERCPEITPEYLSYTRSRPTEPVKQEKQQQLGVVGILWNKNKEKWSVQYKRGFYAYYTNLDDAKEAMEKAPMQHNEKYLLTK